ncbi:uncharacterized protein LOC112051092 [Bicyclus anynana]|uniref:Uncharacterized protein LOC112051092 n=1 Tax=Bicyclus anynana TaxID=110368 RepID=A0ABM3M6F1_BICAN|nr:uncharacterized protein LOC112051092 [Bicyclus anynana]
MSATFEESVFDFDINFLQPSVNAESRVDKQRRQILITKKKAIAIDALIKKFYAQREKWEQNEVVLLTAKEECKQVCINYQEALEKCTQLEKAMEMLNSQNEELNSKYTVAQNQYDGLKSYVNQLQLLIKEHESVIEALKVEKNLEKSSSEDYQANLSSIQKENKALLKHMRLLNDIALGKKKLRNRHKELLRKYDFTEVSSEDDSSSDDSCDFFDDPPQSPLITSLEDCAAKTIEKNILETTKIEMAIKKDLIQFNENDSDCSNEIVSEDTGCGSSLAFSDGDKCFSSPDYFNNDSPENIPRLGKTKEKKILIDSGTNPNSIHEVVHVATSPLIFDDVALLTDSNTLFPNESDPNTEYYINEIPLSNEIVTIKEKRKLIDIGTSPIKDMEKVHIATSPVLFEKCVELNKTDIDCEKVHVATSPLMFEECVELNETSTVGTADADCQTSNVTDNFTIDISNRKERCIFNEDSVSMPNSNGKHTVIDNLETHGELEISGKTIEERKCLERNNSKKVCDDHSNDDEIDMILSSMRLSQRFITPIPDTPVKMRKDERRKAQNLVENVPETSREHSICRESLKLREDNKSLHKEVANLSKHVMGMTSWMKKIILAINSKENICNERDIDVPAEIFDDTSQETIIIYPNDDDSNNVNKETRHTDFDVSNSLRNELSSITEPDENNCTDNTVQTASISHDISEEAPSLNVSESFVVIETVENELSSGSLNNDVHNAKNDSCEAITFEEDLRSDSESDIIINNGVHTTTNMSPIECGGYKKKKHNKLSKLDKFKKKLLPKSKISKAEIVTRKTRRKHILTPASNLPRVDATTILNNKSAYENAAKVMAEIKIKEKDSVNKKRITRKVRKTVKDKNDCKIDEECLDQSIAKRNLRRKSNDQQNFIEKRTQSIESLDDEPLSTIRTRSRSQKLSISSPVCTETSKRDSSESEEKKKIINSISTDTRAGGNKRVLRSYHNRNTVDLDCVEKTPLSGNEELISDTPFCTRRKRNSRDEKQYVNDNVNNIADAPNTSLNDTRTRNRKRKLSNTNDEQNINDNGTVSNKIQDRRISRIENLKQNYTHCIKDVSVVLSKIDDITIFQTENETNNITGSIIASSNIQDQGSSYVNRKTQKNEEVSIDPLDNDINHPKQSILCKMLEKHGRGERKSPNEKVSDNVINNLGKKLEERIASINELPVPKVKLALKKLVDEVLSWDPKHFMLGFMAYLKDPDRKTELYNKVNSPPAPPMTKSEQVVLYIVRQMETKSPNTVNMVLNYIEFSLFQLNRSPDFDVIESLSHVYALLCRYFGLKSRLRLFLLDAMYCLQFKVVPLIKQCLDVWMHILPLAHMGIAKSPLVTCLVYLLHFYKCEDKYNRVTEIRNILNKKYFYQFGDWNEPKILEMFKNAIKEVRDIPLEKKMLRMALILLGKRHGPKWCHKNIVKNMLMPLIESDKTPLKTKLFCVQTLGALLKPFPADMKVDLEISINYMLDMLKQDPPDAMKEAIFTSLIYLNHHNPGRVTRELLLWRPKQVSPELEALLRDYVRTKKLNTWKQILSKTKM